MNKIVLGTSLSAVMLVSAAAQGQVLFSENFNTDVSSAWTVNDSAFTDNAADFFFDYSLSGIPEAPNSGVGDTPTRGLQLRVNEFFETFGGFSVSPTGLDLGTGDYVLTFDLWENTIGPMPIGGSGSTQFGTYGVLTSGTSAAEAGEATVDGVHFGATGDGNSGADFRAYSVEVNFSHQPGEQTGGVDVYFAPDEDPDPVGNNERNGSNAYYSQFGDIAPPAAQTALFPQQTGNVQVGAIAFAWHEAEITKIGNVVTFTLDGLPIARVDTTDFTNPTGGNNILFGRNDVNGSSSADPDEALLLFTLIDNIRVEVLTAGIEGDLDGDGFVGIADLNLVLSNWNEEPPDVAEADPTGDGFVGIEDLNVVLSNWNAGTPPAANAVPEPATLALLGLGGVAMLRRRR